MAKKDDTLKYIIDNYDDTDVVDTGRMILPNMEDFHLSDIEIMNEENAFNKDYIDLDDPSALRKKQEQEQEPKINAVDFCIDSHIDFDNLGYIDDKKYFLLKAIPDLNSEAIELNQIDGDTIKFKADSVSGVGPFSIGNNSYKSFNDYLAANAQTQNYDTNNLDFSVRMLGMDAPEIPHYSRINLSDYSKGDYKIETFKYKDIKNHFRFIYEKKKYNDNDELEFIQFKNSDTGEGKLWNQYFRKNNTLLSTDESTPETIDAGYRAQEILINTLNAANDTYIMLDGVTLSNDSLKYNHRYKARDRAGHSETHNNLMEFIFGSNGFKFLGFNAFGQDMYKRYLGAIYVNINKSYLPKEWQKDIKTDTVTINLAKYLIANVELDVLPDFNKGPIVYSTGNFVSDQFKISTYNLNDTKNYDAYKIFEKLDDREKIQSEIFGKSLDELRDWTVSIGDTVLFIPPESIRTITQNTSERAPLMRAKGAVTKSTPKAKTTLEMKLYFNDDHGINGYEYDTRLPNGEPITYHMNGLRSLIAQFKLTPFLPIENDYINRVLNIEAVTLVNLQITTMPNYPKCISATITLDKFNYRVYMPEMPVDTDIETFSNTNYFAKTINFPTMRWYYQQPIINGEKVLNYNLRDETIYPQELLIDTFGNRTMLAPMIHYDSNIDFFVPNEELLKQKLQVKMEAGKKAITNTYRYTDESEKFVNIGDSIYTTLKKLENNNTINNLKETDYMKVQKEFYKIPDVNEVIIKQKSDNVEIIIRVDQIISRDELDRFKEWTLGDEKEKIKDFYKNNQFNLLLKHNRKGYEIDKKAPDYRFLTKMSQMVLENGEIQDLQGEVDDIKQGMDLELYDSMEFVRYDMDHVNIANISCAYQNTLPEITLNGIDGYAPQYMGGQDTVIEIIFQTANESVAAQLEALPNIVAEQIRTYREVITSWPLRISSDITNILGIYEVVVESVQIDTVPNQPGVYNIQMRLISVDRTLRNREALIKLDNVNNEGYYSKSTTPYKDLSTYFDLQASMGKVEVYPDLELPETSVMDKTGLPYVKNKNLPSQKYVDPDFYFIYTHSIFHEMLRDGITEYFDNMYEEFSKDIDMIDGYGGKATLNFDGSDKIYDIKNQNEVYDEQNKQIEKLIDNTDKIGDTKLRTENDVQLEKMSNLSKTTPLQDWNISENIKVILLDKKDEIHVEKKEDNPIKSEFEEKLKNAEKIMHYLKTQPVMKMSGVENQDPTSDVSTSSYSISDNNAIQEAFSALFGNINREIGVTPSDIGMSEEKSFANYMKAAHVAATAEREYIPGDEGSGEGRTFYDSAKSKPIGLVSGGPQDMSGLRKPSSVDDMIKNAATVGPYTIPLRSREEVQKIIGKSPKNKSKSKYVLDPYYMELNDDDPEMIDYIKLSTTYDKFANMAFLRLVLFWQAKMIIDRVLPPIASNYQLEAVKGINTSTKAPASEREDIRDVIYTSQPEDEIIDKDIKKDLTSLTRDNKRAYQEGTVFLPILMALLDDNTNIYSMLKDKNYGELNNYKEVVMNGEFDIEEKPDYSLVSDDQKFRRFILGLVKYGVIKKVDHIHIDNTTAGDMINNYVQEKIILAAAEDPQQYMLHSFVDMVSNDKRGRMLRAFPTFYMCFIDEGYKTGSWKLTDNFYNYNAVSEIQVMRSRKVPSDTANITMYNMFNTFTTDDEDIKENYRYNFKDIFQSYLYPYKDYQKRKQLKEEFSSVERAKLKPGARVHIRMGYGANASTLPTVFNGSIAEVANGPVVNVVAQGDGIELLNPIVALKDAEEMKNADKFLSSVRDWVVKKETPKTILTSILGYKGGFINSKIENMFDGRIGNHNPLGIFHFGNPNNTDIFLNSEISQNIYEASASSPWNTNDSVASMYSTKEHPKTTFGVFGKTVWDVVHICDSISPDYISAVNNFGLRSSIFHGAPRYYYAYDYVERDGMLYEKRKPYQQFHLYTSFSDIVANGISVSERDMKTVAIGTYTSGKNETGKQKTVGPLWADFMIYPEKQKTMIYNTQLGYKGAGIMGALGVNYLIDNLADDTGKMQSGHAVAWRSTANALKNAIKEMYQGELVVLGDPTVKPHDRIFLSDIYENMSGPCMVEAVTHTMSLETGYLTSITPDVIAVVDDRHEIQLQSLAGKALLNPTSAYYAATFLASAFAGAKQPLLKVFGHTIKKSGASITKKGLFSFGSKKIAPGVGQYLSSAGERASQIAMAGTAAVTLPQILVFAAEMAVVYIATSLLTEAIERKMRNYRVLQVFPLTKNGLTYTAGLNGSKGLVFGSPTYEDAGAIGDLFDKLIIKHPDDNLLVKGLKTFFTTDNMQQIALSYQKNNNISDSEGNAVHEIASSGVLEAITQKEMNNQMTANEMSKHSRLDLPAQKLDGYSYIYNSTPLKQLNDQGRFTTTHENVKADDSVSVDSKYYGIHNAPNKIKAINYKKENVYDLQIVDSRLLEAIEVMSIKATNKNKKSEITLLSGLQINQNSQQTSNTAIVQITDADYSDIKSHLNELAVKYNIKHERIEQAETEEGDVCILLKAR